MVEKGTFICISICLQFVLFTQITVADFSRKCSKPGDLCKSCSEWVFCIKNDDGFEEVPIAKCNVTDKQYCTSVGGVRCAAVNSPQCDGTANIKFICSDPGIFPDPFDCQKYHFCVPSSSRLEHTEATCPSHYEYSVETGFCGKPYQGCESPPIYTCSGSGQRGPIAGNKKMYYICQEISNHLYPSLHMCPGNLEFVSSVCQPPKYETHVSKN